VEAAARAVGKGREEWRDERAESMRGLHVWSGRREEWRDEKPEWQFQCFELPLVSWLSDGGGGLLNWLTTDDC